MKKLKTLIWLIVLTSLSYDLEAQTAPAPEKISFYVTPKTQEEADKLVAEWLKKMTLEEKVGQMTQLTLDVVSKGKDKMSSDEPLALDSKIVKEAIGKYKVGSILNTGNNRARTREIWQKIIYELQDVSMKEIKIPMLYGIDAIHGTTYTAESTFFPQQIGLAATWNTDLAKIQGEITAYETRASNIPWDFSPVLDLGRDPRWPRMWETFGEDVYLTTQMGKAIVKGYEGNENGEYAIDNQHVASCLKHFLGYGVPTNGKDRTPSLIPEIELRERHIPAFKAAIDAGASSIMINSGLINGTPVHQNYEILTELLRNELGFKGLVVTDWADIHNLVKRDKITPSVKEAVKKCINAGIDMAMVPYSYDFTESLIELVNEKEVSMERIDEAVGRILHLKYKLGLFEKYKFDYKEYNKFASKAFTKSASEAALESITLLKNEGDILPLAKGKKVLVTGPNANSMRTLNGGWTYSWQGEKVHEFAQDYNTILEAIQNKIGKENVIYEAGVNYKMDGLYWEEENIDIAKAVEKAKDVEYIVLCLGENTYTEKPGDLDDLYISDNQEKLAQELLKTGKPVILILNEGRPRIIRRFADQMKGIFQIYLPGNFGGDALAETLFGDANPSGKLPYTYPSYPNALIPYDHKPADEQVKMEGTYDYASNFKIQFPFGHGLSYTTFEYNDLKISQNTLKADDEIEVSVSVKNTGKVAGKEVVQLFSRDLYASVTPDMIRLRKFQKIELKPNETKTVTFKLSANELAYVGTDNQWVIEKGEFVLQVKKLTQKIEVTETKKLGKFDNHKQF